jgi:hypothetical protein
MDILFNGNNFEYSQRMEAGWREILIDIDPAAGTEKFRYVISRTSTPASKTLIKVCKLYNY